MHRNQRFLEKREEQDCVYIFFNIPETLVKNLRNLFLFSLSSVIVYFSAKIIGEDTFIFVKSMISYIYCDKTVGNQSIEAEA